MNSILAIVVAGTVSVAATWARGQELPAQIGGLNVPAGQIELARLVDLAAQRLGLNLDYDPGLLKGALTIRTESPLSDEELWLLTNRVLASRGFTTVQNGGDRSYSVVRLTDAPGLAQMGSSPGELPGGFTLVTAKAQHRPAKDLVDPVSKVLSKPGGSVQVLGDSGLLLIADLAPRVEQALAVLKLVDTPLAPAVVREVPIKNIAAPALSTLLAQVSAKRELVSGQKMPGEILPSPNGGSVLVICPAEHEGYWTDLITALDKREQVQTQSYRPRTFALKEVATLIEQTVMDQPGLPPDDRWRLVQDELTGTLIITATPSQHEAIDTLVSRLNATPAAVARPVRAFILRNRPVDEIRGVLEQLVSAGVLGAGLDPAQGSSTESTAPPGLLPGEGIPAPPPGTVLSAPPATPAFPTLEPQPTTRTLPPAQYGRAPAGSESPITFTSDKGTNTLIAMGEPRLLAQIEDLLRTLDVRQPQVMLEVLILSLSDSQTLDLGVEIEQLQVSGDVLIRLASLFGLSFRGPGGDRIVGDGQGFTGVVLSPGDFSVVLRALQTVNNGRSLSMPKVLVANNQVGTIDSVLEVPFASTNASSTVATTSLGGVRPAGTQVTIKPQIASGDHLNLDYSVSLSAFVGAAADPQLPPPRQQNSINSTATIPDGYTVAVGGIELTSDARATSQIPFFGQIPIVGEAFKRRSKNTSRQRFYVFIRANVYRQNGFEDLKYISDRETVAAGVDDGWPVLEPRVIR